MYNGATVSGFHKAIAKKRPYLLRRLKIARTSNPIRTPKPVVGNMEMKVPIENPSAMASDEVLVFKTSLKCRLIALNLCFTVLMFRLLDPKLPNPTDQMPLSVLFPTNLGVISKTVGAPRVFLINWSTFLKN